MSNIGSSVFVMVVVLFVFACNRPVAEFFIGTKEVKVLQKIKFENTSKNAEFYEWRVDGQKFVEENPSYVFYRSGEHEIILTAINTKKSDTYTKKINVLKSEKTLVEIETKFGSMIIELYDDTPLHRDNFVKLAKEGFYNDLLFHRVINEFMIQGGDPNSRDTTFQQLGSGGPGYQIESEIDAGHLHFKGALAAARQGDAVNPQKKSSGSQFYIVHGKPISEQDLKMFEAKMGTSYTEDQKKRYMQSGGTPFLDGNYTVFGQVLKGLDVIDSIAHTQTGMADRPIESIQMKINVIE